ncbi:MAG: hypothetical protein CVU97_04115 [Firmicutes bacterium HGW-Firmicutes-21]|nr:MAG: hypothetical protein CVU97_04115 [Firmicutes bacterium HGW-Firmicutes-21]
MSSNEKLVCERYDNPLWEDDRATKSRADHMEFHYTKKVMSKYIDLTKSVAEIGCATGYYGMYFADKCKDYLGIDITPANIIIFNEKIKTNSLNNVRAIIGDATNLKEQADNTFDVVMVLGPMYHLPPEERILVFEESKRICMNNGIIAYAYINKTGAYMKGCLLEGKEHIYPNKKANDYILHKGVDDIHTELFFFTIPEEMEKTAKECGLIVLENVGVNFSLSENRINNMSEEQFEAWTELNDLMCSSPSCTGMSIHSLLICRKA